MPASLSLPPRQTRSDFEALASDRMPFGDCVLVLALLVIVAAGIVGFCVTLAGV